MKYKLTTVHTSDIEAALAKIERYERALREILDMESCLLADAQEIARKAIQTYQNVSVGGELIDESKQTQVPEDRT